MKKRFAHIRANLCGRASEAVPDLAFGMFTVIPLAASAERIFGMSVETISGMVEAIPFAADAETTFGISPEAAICRRMMGNETGHIFYTI